ncbi:ankyrin repeat domain-containing protein [Rickettsia endosymbiont of Gonocerus acuteangulatus]|uniref:ankyrin repeat domain-containing protein n=1 Tax=Rickettsia endosymbiont of Gonocerus acuteangulatus TaxID=3066266 RepID=UPI003132B6E9
MQVEAVKKEIDRACLFGYTFILEDILKTIPNFLNSKYYDPSYLRTAYLDNNKHIISILLQAGASPDTSYIGLNPLLYDACLEGKEDIVNIFLNAGANPNIRKQSGESPLRIAAHKNHVNIVKSLLKHGADLEDKTENLLSDPIPIVIEAVMNGYHDVVKLLLQYGTNLNIELIKKSALMFTDAESKNSLALTIICRDESFTNMSIDTPNKLLPSFLKWKASIKPYDIEFKTKPLKLHLVEIYNLSKYLKTLEEYKDSKELKNINNILDCFPEIVKALDNDSKPIFSLKNLAILKLSEIENFQIYLLYLSFLTKNLLKKLKKKKYSSI